MSSRSSSLSERSVNQGPLSCSMIQKRLRLSVGGSLCSPHFKGFQTFHQGYRRFCKKIFESGSKVQDEIYDLFPVAPKRLGVAGWSRIAAWANKKCEGRMKRVVVQWSEEGLKMLLQCEECKQVRGKKQEEVKKGGEGLEMKVNQAANNISPKKNDPEADRLAMNAEFKRAYPDLDPEHVIDGFDCKYGMRDSLAKTRSKMRAATRALNGAPYEPSESEHDEEDASMEEDDPEEPDEEEEESSDDKNWNIPIYSEESDEPEQTPPSSP